jgi:hypothetical protein
VEDLQKAPSLSPILLLYIRSIYMWNPCLHV